jgi:hypothetical protein
MLAFTPTRTHFYYLFYSDLITHTGAVHALELTDCLPPISKCFRVSRTRRRRTPRGVVGCVAVLFFLLFLRLCLRALHHRCHPQREQPQRLRRRRHQLPRAMLSFSCPFLLRARQTTSSLPLSTTYSQPSKPCCARGPAVRTPSARSTFNQAGASMQLRKSVRTLLPSCGSSRTGPP